MAALIADSILQSMKAPSRSVLAGSVVLLLGGFAMGFMGHKLKLPPHGYLSAMRAWWTEPDAPEPEEPSAPDKGKFYLDRPNPKNRFERMP